MSARDHSCEVCGGGGLNSPPAPDCSCGSSWMERVEAQSGHIIGSIGEWVPANLAREMAERLDALAERKTDDEVIVTGTGASVQRVWEDAEVGRLLRELDAQLIASHTGWVAIGNTWPLTTGRGPTRLAALQALAEAVKE